MEVVSGDEPELAPDYARDNPYASYFSYVCDNVTLRLPYWSVNDSGITPQFIIKTGDKPVGLRKVELHFQPINIKVVRCQ